MVKTRSMRSSHNAGGKLLPNVDVEMVAKLLEKIEGVLIAANIKTNAHKIKLILLHNIIMT